MWPRKIAAGRLESGARTYEKRYTDDELIDSESEITGRGGWECSRLLPFLPKGNMHPINS